MTSSHRARGQPRRLIRVRIVWSPGPRQWQSTLLLVAPGTTVEHALQAADLLAQSQNGRIAIWGRKATLDQRLADGDRIELCRLLRVDPKVARRERFEKQGVRTAGLFAR